MKKLFVLIFIIFCLTGSLSAQWVLIDQSNNHWYSLHFTNYDTGYAVGLSNTGGVSMLLSTWDGFENIATRTLTNDLYFGVYFLDGKNGFAVGLFGAILKITNGGNNFSKVNSGTTQSLYGIYFPNRNTGYIAGNHGAILKTTDGGITWNPQTSGTTRNLKSVYFVNSTTGYIAGDSSIILKTTDGGSNWLPLTLTTTFNISSINFTDINTGYIAGKGGKIFKTINGGTLWSSQNSGGTDDLTCIDFVNKDTGYITGFDILKTVNGGVSWISQSNPSSYPLNSVSFPEKNHGFAVGYGGVILEYGTHVGIKKPKNAIDNLNISLYPNPFKDNLSLSYELRLSSKVTISITDISGHSIKVLADEFQNAGKHLLTIDPSMLNQSIYYLRVDIDNSTNSYKLMHIE